MNVVISIAEHEIEMANRWFDWVLELGGTNGHSLYLIPAAGLDIHDIMTKAVCVFQGRVKRITDDEGQTGDWQSPDQMRSAAGPNSAFRQVAWYFYHNKLGPYFWCELDCIPTNREWLDRFDTEYKVAVSKGKVFVGAHVEIPQVPEHMSGNAIYPTNVPEEAPTLIMRTNWTPNGQERSFELAFDIAGAKEVVPKAHFTNLIQHKFRYEGFKSRTEFDAVIDPNAVVFHSDKKGTIYKYLRENLSGGGDSIAHGGALGGVAAVSIPYKTETLTAVPAPGGVGKVHGWGSSPHADEARGSTTEERSVQKKPRDGSQSPSRDELVKDAVSVLKSLCTSPRATSQVRKELKRQKVVR